MARINEIRLYGTLGAQFGRQHRFVASTPRQAVNALNALVPGFARELALGSERGVRYGVFLGRDSLRAVDLDRPTGGQPVRLIPVITGSKSDGLWQTVEGAALLSAGALSLFWENPYAFGMMGLGASLALGGVAQMISAHTPAVANPGAYEPQNVVAQGGPVPLLYGRMRVGSTIISAHTRAVDMQVAALAMTRHSVQEGGSESVEVEDLVAAGATDSLKSGSEFEVVDLISEGRIAGLATAGAPLRSVYLDGVPVESADGRKNFDINASNFAFLKGSTDQMVPDWLDAACSEVVVGVDVRRGRPWSLMLAEPDVDELAITFRVEQLLTHDSKGREKSASLEFLLEVSDDGMTYRPTTDRPMKISGLCRGHYERTLAVRLDGVRPAHRWIRLSVLSDDIEKSRPAILQVRSYVKRRCARFRYPCSAVAALRLRADSMSRVPVRTYDVEGLMVQVPSNYDPRKRTYSNRWDGTFRQEKVWTDNPAWIFYDLLLNRRYGAGRWVDGSMVDRYALYAIARYCDELVSDGRGGQEPRFTCNCHITDRTHAFALLQQLASVFRGMAYWSAGTVTAVADMPSDPAYVYVPANVVNGQFRYAGSSLKTRYTVATVSWRDPDNDFRESVESVEDESGVQRYGANKVELCAFGCTSRAQAQRAGYWFLHTSRLETDTVVFEVGLDGVLARPGQIIAICDPGRASSIAGGRVVAVPSPSRIQLDRNVQAQVGDSLSIVMPDTRVHQASVTRCEGAMVAFDRALPDTPQKGAVWMLDPHDSPRQLFRVTSVVESEGGTGFTITATQYDATKFASVDRAAMIDIAGSDDTLPVAAPENLRLTAGITKERKPCIDVSCDPVSDAMTYVFTCQAHRPRANAIEKASSTPRLYLSGIDPGQYAVSVHARLWDGRISRRTYGWTVVHARIYPQRLHVEQQGAHIHLRCEVAGDIHHAHEFRFMAGPTPYFSQARLLASNESGECTVRQSDFPDGGFVWVQVRYRPGILPLGRYECSEWYPAEADPGIRI